MKISTTKSVIIVIAASIGALVGIAFYYDYRRKKAEADLKKYITQFVVHDNVTGDSAAIDSHTFDNTFNYNNAGNIMWFGVNWYQGEIGGVNYAGLAKFSDVRYGISAIAKILWYYQSHYGLNTIRQMVTRYAPPSDNNTNQYIEFVTAGVHSYTGFNNVNADSVIDFTATPMLVTVFVHYIIKMEQSKDVPYSFINFCIANF